MEIGQVPVSKHCPDPVISGTWMLFIATILNGLFTVLVDDNTKVWTLPTPLQLATCVYAVSSSYYSLFIAIY